MKRLALLLIVLVALVATAAPASAWPWTPGTGDCTSTKYRTETAAGWRTLVKVRTVTMCRSESGYVTSVNVTVRRFSIPR